MSESYHGMRGLMEPEGWPPAQVYNEPRLGTECSQPINNEERRRRLDAYRKLAEKGLPLTKERVNDAQSL